MATAFHLVRLLIADLDPNRQVLTDDQIVGYLALNGVPDPDVDGAPMWGVRRAAADALDAIASSETLVSKKIRSQDLQTDGPAVADALREHATSLRAQADTEEASAADQADDVLTVLEFHPWGH